MSAPMTPREALVQIGRHGTCPCVECVKANEVLLRTIEQHEAAVRDTDLVANRLMKACNCNRCNATANYAKQVHEILTRGNP